MKIIIILLSSILLFAEELFSQDSIDNIINEIEKNNTTLSALRKNADAERISNKTGLYLKKPEIAFNYLWGSPETIGNRTDISILQSFDFPSAYAYRSQISDYQNEQVELEYQRQRKSILFQTRLVCNDIIYNNALKSELSKRIANAQNIANSYKSKYEIGDAGILEYNKAQINLLNLSKVAESIEIERNALLSALKMLNGGIFVEFSDSTFQFPTISSDFEEWYSQAEQNNPVLQWLKQEVIIRQKQEKLNTALGLPKFQAGYMSEEVVGQQFQGITVGMSIPLLENKNAVKYAKAKTIAVQSAETDTRLQFYNSLKALHEKAIDLQNSLNDYRIKLQLLSNSVLLQKALDKGEISIAEYIYELSIYYESSDKLLTLERNMNMTILELNKYQ
jgi:outer membrane protein, heavy metal efflux system